MNKIIIDPHYCSREEFAELKQYLDDNAWNYREETKSKDKEILYTLSENKINGEYINDKIRDEELHEYYIQDRKEFIDTLIDWISEAKSSNKELMKQDLEMLMDVEDDYILSSNSTNSYLYQGCADFNETCKELIELSKEL